MENILPLDDDDIVIGDLLEDPAYWETEWWPC